MSYTRFVRGNSYYILTIVTEGILIQFASIVLSLDTGGILKGKRHGLNKLA